MAESQGAELRVSDRDRDRVAAELRHHWLGTEMTAHGRAPRRIRKAFTTLG